MEKHQNNREKGGWVLPHLICSLQFAVFHWLLAGSVEPQESTSAEKENI